MPVARQHIKLNFRACSPITEIIVWTSGSKASNIRCCIPPMGTQVNTVEVSQFSYGCKGCFWCLCTIWCQTVIDLVVTFYSLSAISSLCSLKYNWQDWTVWKMISFLLFSDTQSDTFLVVPRHNIVKWQGKFSMLGKLSLSWKISLLTETAIFERFSFIFFGLRKYCKMGCSNTRLKTIFAIKLFQHCCSWASGALSPSHLFFVQSISWILGVDVPPSSLPPLCRFIETWAKVTFS